VLPTSMSTTTRMFGLFSRTRGQTIELTELGQRIVDPSQTDAARVEAFLGIPLYQALHEQHKGGLLPGSSGLEEEMVSLGVTRKSASRARQAFQRSAEYAGFFRQGRNRLVVPQTGVIRAVDTVSNQTEERDEKAGFGGRATDIECRVHPLLEGLWASLPAMDEPFSSSQQDDWIEMAKLALKMVYGSARESDARP